MSKVYDLIGVGFGPANIAVAALLEEEGSFNDYLFLERSTNPVWQSEMLFDNALDIHSNIQNVPHRDLATLRSPRSRFTFMNYLHENRLLLQHLNMDLLMPMRPDYAAYIRWVAEQLSDNVRTGQSIRSITMLDARHSHLYRIDTENGDAFFTRHIVLGTGREPMIPPVFKAGIASGRVFHMMRFNSCSKDLLARGARKIAVLGSSQSAIEIVLQLSKIEPRIDVHSIFRRFAYPLKDTNPFMSEIYFPEFTDLYYGADKALKARIDRDVYRTNYGACDMDVLEELYRQIYYDRMHGHNRIQLKRMTEVQVAEPIADGVVLTLLNGETHEVTAEAFDGVILATGFQNIGPAEDEVKVPAVLDGITDQLDLGSDGCISVSRDYLAKLKPSLERAGGLVLNGLCETTHGMGDAGSVSLLSLRAQTIVNALLAKDSGVRHSERTGIILKEMDARVSV